MVVRKRLSVKVKSSKLKVKSCGKFYQRGFIDFGLLAIGALIVTAVIIPLVSSKIVGNRVTTQERAEGTGNYTCVTYDMGDEESCQEEATSSYYFIGCSLTDISSPCTPGEYLSGRKYWRKTNCSVTDCIISAEPTNTPMVTATPTRPASACNDPNVQTCCGSKWSACGESSVTYTCMGQIITASCYKTCASKEKCNTYVDCVYLEDGSLSCNNDVPSCVLEEGCSSVPTPTPTGGACASLGESCNPDLSQDVACCGGAEYFGHDGDIGCSRSQKVCLRYYFTKNQCERTPVRVGNDMYVCRVGLAELTSAGLSSMYCGPDGAELSTICPWLFSDVPTPTPTVKPLCPGLPNGTCVRNTAPCPDGMTDGNANYDCPFVGFPGDVCCINASVPTATPTRPAATVTPAATPTSRPTATPTPQPTPTPVDTQGRLWCKDACSYRQCAGCVWKNYGEAGWDSGPSGYSNDCTDEFTCGGGGTACSRSCGDVPAAMGHTSGCYYSAEGFVLTPQMICTDGSMTVKWTDSAMSGCTVANKLNIYRAGAMGSRADAIGSAGPWANTISFAEDCAEAHSYVLAPGCEDPSSSSSCHTSTFSYTPAEPTVPACLRGDLGNMDCSSDGKIDQTDLDMVTCLWVTPGSIGCGNKRSGDLNNDRIVNLLDMAIVLKNWGVGELDK